MAEVVEAVVMVLAVISQTVTGPASTGVGLMFGDSWEERRRPWLTGFVGLLSSGEESEFVSSWIGTWTGCVSAVDGGDVASTAPLDGGEG